MTVVDVALWVLYTLAALGGLSALLLGGWILAHKITHRTAVREARLNKRDRP